MRLFFALWPDDATRAALAAAARRVSWRDGRPVAEVDLHLTLAFLGEVSTAQFDALLARAAATVVPRFELDIASVGWWRRSRVAWLAPRGVPAPLSALAAALHCGADHGPTHAESYRPHITVARGVRQVPGLMAGVSVPWSVGDFALISSNSAAAGARYRVLAQWPLGPAVFD